MSTNGPKRPGWERALITGASSGIGASFATRLAAAGTDLVVVARRRERLEALADELAGRHGRQVEVLVADLTDPVQLASVEARLHDDTRPVDLLVNNAGFGSRGSFVDLPVDHEEALLRIHVVAVLRLTHAALRGMVARGHGGVINVSSISGVQAIPYWATYSAAKAFMTRFSKAVHEEVRDRGVTVLALQPGFTRTEFHDHADFARSTVPGPFWRSADMVVDAALADAARGRSECIPGLSYRALAVAARFSPWAITRRLARSAASLAARDQGKDDAGHDRHQQTGGDRGIDPDVPPTPGEVSR